MKNFIRNNLIVFLAISNQLISLIEETPSQFFHSISSEPHLCGTPIVLFDGQGNGIITWGTFDGSNANVYVANYTEDFGLSLFITSSPKRTLKSLSFMQRSALAEKRLSLGVYQMQSFALGCMLAFMKKIGNPIKL